MTVLAAYAVPHPPVIVPAVGHGRERQVQATVDAYQEVARRICAAAPDVIVLTSPHAELYLDWFHIAPGARAQGSFAQFGAARASYELVYDEELVGHISERCDAAGIAAGTAGERSPELDHGTLVPVHFIREAYRAAKRELPPFVRIGLSGFSPLEHYRLGQEIAAAAKDLGRNLVFVASGDLSHKMAEDGPYGFAPEGPKFDDAVCHAFSTGDFLQLMTIDPELCERAAECGLRSFQIMAGALDRTPVRAELLSHEGTLGVGYAIAAFTPAATAAPAAPAAPAGKPADEARAFGDRYRAWHAERMAARKRNEDLYVRLARRALEAHVGCGRDAAPTRTLLQQLAGASRSDAVREGRAVASERGDLAAGTTGSLYMKDALDIEDLLTRRAGVFVSLKKDGRLRGCIGTIRPVRGSIAEEICSNAIAAGTRDPRFPALEARELSELVYDVDVLTEPEPVADASALDPARYGVIVSAADGRRGLLLPDLEGVDTVERQLSIAAQKGGIDLARDQVTLERFEVVRHL